jgi:NADH-quinone oxidoreductase subunit L
MSVVGDWLVLEHWLEPVFEDTVRHLDSGTTAKIMLTGLSVIAGLAGIAFAVRAWLQHKVDTDALEPSVLENAMYVDDAYAWVVSNPGEEAFQVAADFDQRGIDGAVDGVGKVVLAVGGITRRLQTGYIRNYAAAIATGAIAVVVYFVVRGAV